MKAIQSLLVIFFSLFSSSAFPDNKPNIVLILIDDLGLTDIQAYGGEISTPNMDSLASEGMLLQTITQLQSVHHQGLCF